MTVAAGSRLGPYEILSQVGAGGMGEVYKARDTRLERTVAIKVLPSQLSADPDLRSRFEREARTISQLSHPHICALHDVGSEGGTEYLVMEFLEGETLLDRLSKGPLPTAPLLSIGIQIADALDRAHRQGIVHRDLKPANVMLTKSGVKLLDFGLAKAIAAPAPLSGLTALPTLAGGQNMTQAGTILGTFQYMAPEQLEGKEADGRTDIFALGTVLYEMATGKKAFSGASHASLIAAILEHEPAPMSSLQPMTPPALERVVRKCLAKDPEERWQSAGDLGSELKWIAEAGSQAGVPAPVVTKRRSRERLAWIGFAVAAAAAAALGAVALRRAPAPQSAVRSSLLVPEKVVVQTLTVSPDGAQVVFSAADAQGTSALWIRPLGGSEPRLLAGTQNAVFPFWSPDSRSIGFFASQKLKRIDVGGGSPIVVCDAPDGTGGSWGLDGTILIGQSAGPVLRVAASGGTPAAVTKLEPKSHETSHRYPFFLPDGRRFLYLALDLLGPPDSPDNNVCVASLDGREARRVLHGYSSPVYAAGRLLVVRDAHLVAQPFDLGRLRISGEPFTLAEDVGTYDGFIAFGQFSASESGVLVYANSGYQPRLLQWVDRTGRRLSVIGESALYSGPNLSRDGRKALVSLLEPSVGKTQVWLVDLSRGTKTRVTSGPSENWSGVFSPDGTRVAFASDRAHQADLYVKAVNGLGDETPLVGGEGQRVPVEWSPDGRYILYFEREPRGLRRVGLTALPLFGDKKPFTVLEKSVREEMFARISPDGRWLAYSVDDSGRSELYVVAFPDGAERWQVASGSRPMWRGDGRELFFTAPDGMLMSVDVAGGAGFSVGPPRALFDIFAAATRVAASPTFDVSADGQRFLLALPANPSAPPLNLVVPWTALVPAR